MRWLTVLALCSCIGMVGDTPPEPAEPVATARPPSGRAVPAVEPDPDPGVDSGVVTTPDAGKPAVDSGTPVVDAGTSGPCSFPQGLPEEDFIASATSFTDTDPVVDRAVNDAMVSLTGCGVLSSCRLDAMFPAATVDLQCQAFFAAVTAKLRAQGLCAGQHIVGDTDEIAVSNTGCTGKWYGYHVCNYGGPLVVWNPGARRGWWQIKPASCQGI